MKNVIQAKAKENQRQSGGDQKSVSQKSDEANVMRFEITLPLKNFLSWPDLI